MKHTARQKGAKIKTAWRLSAECVRRLSRAAKRSGKTKTRILEDAILAGVPMYAKEAK